MRIFASRNAGLMVGLIMVDAIHPHYFSHAFRPLFGSQDIDLLEQGIDRIREHDDALVNDFIAGLDAGNFEVLSPRENGPRRSTLIFFSHRDRARNGAVYQALARAGIDIALRGGLLRLSPHLHNSTADIRRALAVLNEFPALAQEESRPDS